MQCIVQSKYLSLDPDYVYYRISFVIILIAHDKMKLKKYIYALPVIISTLAVTWCGMKSPEQTTTPMPAAVTNTGAATASQPAEMEQIHTIYALGDSLTAGYQLPLEQSYPAQLEQLLQEKWYSYTVVNGGKSGDTSAGLRERLAWIIADAKSGDIAVVVIWANDGMQSLPLSQLEANIRNTVDILSAKWIQVILWGMQLPTNLNPEYRASFAEMYQRIANDTDLPLIPFFLTGVAGDKALNLRDWIHPTAEWYAVIAQNVLSFMETSGVLNKDISK